MMHMVLNMNTVQASLRYAAIYNVISHKNATPFRNKISCQ